MQFKYHDAPTIAQRVALGGEINRLEGDAIVPFPKTWDSSMLMETFRTNGAGAIYALQNKGFQRGPLYLYADEDGAWIYGILRMNHSTETKQILPIRATRTLGLNPGLEVKAIDAPRPLYGLDVLANEPGRPVIVVEGEKAADAGRIRFPDHAVITWPGGAQGLGQVDLRPLAGRDVTIWPDNDKTGRDAAEQLALLLNEIGTAQVRIVLVPGYFPAKWDVADSIPVLTDA
jgi:putative DNA primase/helicase